MSEEIKNKAVELTDEEMDKVAGGKAFLNEINGNTVNFYSCTNFFTTIEKFIDNKYGVNTCNGFYCFDIKKPKACVNCMYFEPAGSYSIDNTAGRDQLNKIYARNKFEVGSFTVK